MQRSGSDKKSKPLRFSESGADRRGARIPPSGKAGQNEMKIPIKSETQKNQSKIYNLLKYKQVFATKSEFLFDSGFLNAGSLSGRVYCGPPALRKAHPGKVAHQPALTPL